MVTKAEKIADVLDNSSYDGTDIVGNLREAAKYLQENAVNLKESVIQLCNITLDKKADKSAIQTIWTACEKSFASRNLEHVVADVVNKLADVPSKLDLTALSNFVTNQPRASDLISNIAILSAKLETLTLALIALGAKTDTDNTAQNAAVTNSSLDTDFEATIKASLV